MSRSAIIFGASGQDGSYLTRLLLKRGYRVVGSSRQWNSDSEANLRRMGLQDRVSAVEVQPGAYSEVAALIADVLPDEIYYLAGQSSVARSFDKPLETFESNVRGVVNVLEAVRLHSRRTRVFNSGSGDCYGNLGRNATVADEFEPVSPYGWAKATAIEQVRMYRDLYGIHASSGIMFNHESPLRPPQFVTRKVVREAIRISQGVGAPLKLGAIDISRDWGWAPEFVEAMWLMLQSDVGADHVICTGEAHTLESFVSTAFLVLGLDWRNHVEFDASFLRPHEIKASCGNPDEAKASLGWKAAVGFEEMIDLLVRAELEGPGQESPYQSWPN